MRWREARNKLLLSRRSLKADDKSTFTTDWLSSLSRSVDVAGDKCAESQDLLLIMIRLDDYIVAPSMFH